MIQQTNKKTIAKNAVFLYVRMIATVLISLYTARILLKNLGVDNYGLYNLVGGIVLLFSSIKGVFSSVVQRFLNFSHAGEIGNPCKVFSLSLVIHIFIIILFVLVVETAGYFMLPRLNILPERLFAAKCVFHFSVLSSAISILAISYDAVIISREKMAIYAYIAIFESLGKLLIVYLINFFPFDKLINYGILVFLMTVFIFIFQFLYCVSHFSEAKFKWQWDSKLFKDIFGFAGWNFAGNLAYSFTNEGINMLLNLFGGVSVNAARGISYQIKNVYQQLLSNIIIAYRPQCTIKYAQRKYQDFYELLFQSSKLIFALYMIVAFPLFIFLPQILQLWLNQIPEYTVSLMRAILVYMMIRCFHDPIDLVFKSAGQLKKYQINEFFILSLSIPLAFFLLKKGYPFYTVFIGMGVVEFINLITIIKIAKYQFNFPCKLYLKLVQRPCFTLMGFNILLHFILSYHINIPDNTWLVLIYAMCDVIVVTTSIFIIFLNKSEKEIVCGILQKILKFNK